MRIDAHWFALLHPSVDTLPVCPETVPAFLPDAWLSSLVRE
jgi:hypothetical protein